MAIFKLPCSDQAKRLFLEYFLSRPSTNEHSIILYLVFPIPQTEDFHHFGGYSGPDCVGLLRTTLCPTMAVGRRAAVGYGTITAAIRWGLLLHRWPHRPAGRPLSYELRGWLFSSSRGPSVVLLTFQPRECGSAMEGRYSWYKVCCKTKAQKRSSQIL